MNTNKLKEKNGLRKKGKEVERETGHMVLMKIILLEDTKA